MCFIIISDVLDLFTVCGSGTIGDKSQWYGNNMAHGLAHQNKVSLDSLAF